MHVVLLGSAAGGGFPQWNCWCPSCRTARTSPSLAHPRTQSCAAVSADGSRWFLLNASPDVRQQLGKLQGPAEPSTIRHVPVEGVLITDAEIDHSLGLVLLREARLLPVYATSAALAILECDSRVLPLTRAFSDVPATTLPLDDTIPLRHRDGSNSDLTVEAFEVPAGPPRFASAAQPGHTVGLLVREQATGRSCAFVPGCGGLNDRLRARFSEADALLFDGTFWSDDELIRLGIGERTARELDHLPVGGRDGSLEQLGTLPCAHRIYTHINNTNPMLLEHSAERAAVDAAGVTVGYDGLRLRL